MTEPTNTPPLRDRLLALRSDLLDRLAASDVIEPAWLATLANAQVVLDELDRDEAAGGKNSGGQ